jgi:hypothetical protein
VMSVGKAAYFDEWRSLVVVRKGFVGSLLYLTSGLEGHRTQGEEAHILRKGRRRKQSMPGAL